MIFLDARCAFDKTINSILANQMFHAGTKDKRLLYLDNRLCNRITFIQWDRRIMGGIKDEVGIEQGGVHSSDLYTLYNNEHLDNVQDLKLGFSVYGHQVSTLAIGDDVALISDNIFFLKNILRISLNYCTEFHVSLATEKN